MSSSEYWRLLAAAIIAFATSSDSVSSPVADTPSCSKHKITSLSFLVAKMNEKMKKNTTYKMGFI